MWVVGKWEENDTGGGQKELWGLNKKVGPLIAHPNSRIGSRIKKLKFDTKVLLLIIIPNPLSRMIEYEYARHLMKCLTLITPSTTPENLPARQELDFNIRKTPANRGFFLIVNTIF